jgi:hypothetical protein
LNGQRLSPERSANYQTKTKVIKTDELFHHGL